MIPYKIIWVDDTPTWVESVQEALEEFVREHELEPAIDFRENGRDLVKAAASPDLDLLIIDYNLHGENGDELIKAIRASGNLTEVIFYSEGEAPRKRLPGGVDGVFHCARGDFASTYEKVIELTVRKLKDLTVIRGLVIATAIDLEVRIEELMVTIFGDKGDVFRSRVIDKHLFDFAKKAMFLQGMINQWDAAHKAGASSLRKKIEAVKGTLKEFDEDVVQSRNVLAHSRRITKDGKSFLKGINDKLKEVHIDLAWLSRFRANLIKHHDNLERFAEIVGEISR